jgi:hypothetical protein
VSTPATVEIWESNGTSGAEVHTKATGLSFGSVDQPNIVAANNPLVIPAAGNIFAYHKYDRWKVIAWVDTNTINNLKWFKSAGSLAASWSEDRGGSPTQVYATPTRTLLGSGAWPTIAASAQAITGSFTTPTTGYGSNGYYTQLGVYINNLVAAGAKGSHTVSFRYDES